MEKEELGDGLERVCYLSGSASVVLGPIVVTNDVFLEKVKFTCRMLRRTLRIMLDWKVDCAFVSKEMYSFFKIKSSALYATEKLYQSMGFSYVVKMRLIGTEPVIN